MFYVSLRLCTAKYLFKQNIYSNNYLNNKCGLKNHRFHQILLAGKMLIKVISCYLTFEKS